MYEEWILVPWETPFSEVDLHLVAFVDDHRVILVLEGAAGSPGQRTHRAWRVTFPGGAVFAYRNIEEAYRVGLWERMDALGLKAPRTSFIVPGSPWLRSLAAQEPVLQVNAPLLTHYLLLTDDQCFDLLSSLSPSVTEVEPGSPVVADAGSWARYLNLEY